MVIQKSFTLPAYKRGFHLITELVESKIPEMKLIKAGIAQVFIHHTSASLTINENADPTVRADFERHLNVVVPENAPYYRHTMEGSDDMPAHIKASFLGSSVSIPVTQGRFNVGTWQGNYLGEHRDHASGRKLTVTIIGE
jgi:secondary thiamine-phosphate synthase enzyme